MLIFDCKIRLFLAFYSGKGALEEQWLEKLSRFGAFDKFFLLALSLFAGASPTQEHGCLLDSETDISAPISEGMNSADSFVIPVTVAIRLI